MANFAYTEEEFNKNIMEIFNISELLHDTFKINEKSEKFFLSKRARISIKNNFDETLKEDKSIAPCGSGEEILTVDYHVLFHPSYQVPTIYFNAYTGN